MKFVRTEILATLELVARAIASRDAVPALAHVWFSGETVTAYNDVIGIEAPFATDFTGGLRGSVLLGILSNSGAAQVALTAGKAGEMRLKAAGAHAGLVLLPPDEALFSLPKPGPAVAFDAAFVEALNRVLVAVGDDDSSVPEQLGVTVMDVEAAGMLHLLTTDSSTLAAMYVAKPQGWSGKRITIPTAFCRELKRLCPAGGALALSDRDIIATSPSNVRLFARLVAVPNPLDFTATIAKAVVEDLDTVLVPIPPTFDRALRRAAVLLKAGDTATATLYVESNRIGLFVKTALGEIDDVVRLDEGHRHADIEQRIDPRLIVRAVDLATDFYLSDRCLAMSGPNAFLYLVSLQ